MPIHENLTKEAVLAAVAEYERLGRDEFLSVNGRGRAKTHYLFYENKYYDSKAIVGVAHKFVSGTILKKFHGGQPVKKALEKLGFVVIKKSKDENN